MALCTKMSQLSNSCVLQNWKNLDFRSDRNRGDLFSEREWLWLLFEIFYFDFKVLTELDKSEAIKNQYKHTYTVTYANQYERFVTWEQSLVESPWRGLHCTLPEPTWPLLIPVYLASLHSTNKPNLSLTLQGSHYEAVSLSPFPFIIKPTTGAHLTLHRMKMRSAKESFNATEANNAITAWNTLWANSRFK